MRLCLSSRMFATPGENDLFDLGVEEFVRWARSLGYEGITLRPGQLNGQTPVDRVREIADLLEENGMAFSFVMGAPLGGEKSYTDLCRLADHAVLLGCRYLQTSIPSPAQIPWARKLCDYAADRGIGVCPQIHGGTVHDTLPHCLDLLGQVGRENFGFNFETAQLLAQRAEIQGGQAVRALGDRIFTVCVQNYKLEGASFVPCLPGDPGGVDFEDLFAALREIGFQGFVTHISARFPGFENLEVCRAYLRKLRPLMDGAK